MSFEIVEPGQFKSTASLGEGECSLGRSGGGTLLIRAEDLRLVAIEGRAVLLADPATLRVGLRAVRDGEGRQGVAVSMVRGKGGEDVGRRRIQIARALKRVNLTPEAVAGRYQLHVHGTAAGAKELLFIVLTEVRDGRDEGEVGGVPQSPVAQRM